MGIPPDVGPLLSTHGLGLGKKTYIRGAAPDAQWATPDMLTWGMWPFSDSIRVSVASSVGGVCAGAADAAGGDAPD